MGNDTRWTPGPWQRSPSKESGGSFIEHIDAEYVSHVVAFVHASHGMFDPPVATEEDAANAHLIAAAPDGYALAELVMEICGNPKGISEASQEELYEAALQYAKKARGEQS